MCGIGGELDQAGARPADPARVQAMTDALAHRGPDDEGHHLSGPVGLGFRRLAIIDLAAGHQPMSDPDGRVWVAFNGEIYNFGALRAELAGQGHRFRTRSDTEVIVHAYRRWGLAALDRLNGIFGLAIWDEDRRRLVLARDRLGVKPLYWARDGDRLLFGSELRAVLAGLGHRPALDVEAVNLFLRHRYTPSPLTLHQGVRKLAPGWRLVAEGGSVREERWWSYRPGTGGAPATEAEAGAELLERYERAVERQLVSDVPLGLLLSGGVDSALLLALMTRVGGDARTFTVGFGDGYADDELVAARRTAAAFGAHHDEVRIDRPTFEGVLGRVVDIVEEPVASPSIVPMYFVSELARRSVKVALMGQGPDELFGGYRRHLGVRYGEAWRRLPPAAQRRLGAMGAAWLGTEWAVRGAASLGSGDRASRYRDVLSLVPGAGIDALFAPGALAPAAADGVLDCWAELLEEAAGADELGGLQHLELNSALPDELLLYADKLSMHHALEVRVPYLDHEIVELAARLPARMKVARGRGKRLHRRVCRRFLPPEVLRRPKRGFAVNVVDGWFRSALAGGLDDLLTAPDALMFGFLRPEPVRSLLDDHRAGRADNHKLLFSLAVLERWLRRAEAAPAR